MVSAGALQMPKSPDQWPMTTFLAPIVIIANDPSVQFEQGLIPQRSNKINGETHLNWCCLGPRENQECAPGSIA